MFGQGEDESWVNLVTLNQETSSCPIYTHFDFNTCYILSDFLSSFCLIGQSNQNMRAAKSLIIVIFGKLVTTGVMITLHLIEDIQGTQKALLKSQEASGSKLLFGFARWWL